MDLYFLGTGSALRALEHDGVVTTSAFYRENDKLLLIDCGYSAVKKLISLPIWSQIKSVYVVITHCHNDHIGGLAPLIEECLWERAGRREVFVVESPFLKEDIEEYLRIQGVFSPKTADKVIGASVGYRFIAKEQLKFKGFKKLDFLQTRHTVMSCYSLRFYTEDGVILYTGDTEKGPDEFGPGSYEHIYTECCLADFPGNPHLPLKKLVEMFPDPKDRRKVTVSHFDSEECRAAAINAGFDVP